jgi:hypothetical protein
MIPHTIVLEPGLVIHKIYNGYWFFGRPTIEDLRQDLPAVFRIVQRIRVFGNIEVFLNYTPGSDRKGQWASTPLRNSLVSIQYCRW